MAALLHLGDAAAAGWAYCQGLDLQSPLENATNSVIASVLLGLLGLGQAHAAILDFQFSYTFSGGETLERSYSGDPSLAFTTALYDDPNTAGPDQGTAFLSGATPSNFGLLTPALTELPTWLLGFSLGTNVLVALDNGNGTVEFESFTPGKLSIAAVPGPATLWLLATGLAGFCLRCCRLS